MVHRLAALEHDLQDRLQRQHAGACGERVVLTDGVARRDGIVDEGAGLAELGDLRHAQGRHGDLGELRQEQHPVGMVVGGPVGDQGRRVVADHGENGEPEGLAGVGVGPVPHVAGSGAARPRVQAHPLALDALSRERVDGQRCGEQRGGGRDELAVDLHRRLDDLAATVKPDAVDADVDAVTETDHAQEADGPALDGSGRTAAAGVAGGDNLLRGGRQPHAVHDRFAEPGQRRGIRVGVDGVVVAGDQCEAGHGARRDDCRRPQELARGVALIVSGSPRPHRVGEFAGAEAAADREPLGQRRDDGVAVVDLHVDGQDTAHTGVGDAAQHGGGSQVSLLRRDRRVDRDRMVEVHQVQQTLDDRSALIGARGPDQREHRRPGRSDQGVRDDDAGLGCQAGGQRGGGDAAVIGGEVGIPGDRHAGGQLARRRERGGREVATGGNRHDPGHRLTGTVDADQRRAAVENRRGQRHRDGGRGRGDRHDQVEAVLPDGTTQQGTGRCVLGEIAVDDLPQTRVAQRAHRAGHDTVGPADVRGRQDGGDRAGGAGQFTASRVDLERGLARGGQLVDEARLEAVEQCANGLVDSGDARDRNRAGDDAHLVGAVARIVGLPQRVTAPPAANIAVDDRHEVDRLAGGLAQVEEEGDVGRVQDVHGRGRVRRHQGVGGGVRVGDGAVGEDAHDFAGVGVVQACLGALQHLGEALLPGDVCPVRSGVALPDGQFGVAAQPLLVGHGRDVAEVGLGGAGQRRDDLVAAGGHGIGIASDLVEEAPAPRRGVVDLVDVGAELATARGHAGLRVSGADPLVASDGVDEQLLDLGARGGLEGGHGGSADEDAVQRHQRVVVGQ